MTLSQTIVGNTNAVVQGNANLTSAVTTQVSNLTTALDTNMTANTTALVAGNQAIADSITTNVAGFSTAIEALGANMIQSIDTLRQALISDAEVQNLNPHVFAWAKLLSNVSGRQCVALGELSLFDKDLEPGPHLEIFNTDEYLMNSGLHDFASAPSYQVSRRVQYFMMKKFVTVIHNPVAKKTIVLDIYYNSFKFAAGYRNDIDGTPNPNADYFLNGGGWVVFADDNIPGYELAYDWYVASAPDAQLLNKNSNLTPYNETTFNTVTSGMQNARVMKFSEKLIVSQKYDYFSPNAFLYENVVLPPGLIGKSYVLGDDRITFNLGDLDFNTFVYTSTVTINDVDHLLNIDHPTLVINNRDGAEAFSLRVSPAYNEVYFGDETYYVDGDQSKLPVLFTGWLENYYGYDFITHSGIWNYADPSKASQPIYINDSDYTIFPDHKLYGYVNFETPGVENAMNFVVYNDRDATDKFLELLNVPRSFYDPHSNVASYHMGGFTINLQIHSNYKNCEINVISPSQYTDPTNAAYNYKYVILARKIPFANYFVDCQGADKDGLTSWPTGIAAMNAYNLPAP